jgi:hypothetical protein
MSTREMPMKTLSIVAIIAAFSVAGALPIGTVIGSSSAYAAQSGKIKKKHGYSGQMTGKKHSKSKTKRAAPQM